MFNRLKRLYDLKRLSKEALLFYVEYGLITQEDYKQIVGETSPKKK